MCRFASKKTARSAKARKAQRLETLRLTRQLLRRRTLRLARKIATNAPIKGEPIKVYIRLPEKGQRWKLWQPSDTEKGFNSLAQANSAADRLRSLAKYEVEVRLA